MDKLIVREISNNGDFEQAILFSQKAFFKSDMDDLKKLEVAHSNDPMMLKRLNEEEMTLKENFGKVINLPDLLFGAYLDGVLCGTLGFFKQNIPIKKIFSGVSLSATKKVSEVTKLTWDVELFFDLKLLVIKTLVCAIFLVAHKMNHSEYVGSVKPRTFSLIQRMLGRDSFKNIPYNRIIAEEVPLDSRVFYLYNDRPVIFLTNQNIAQDGGRKLEKILKLVVEINI